MDRTIDNMKCPFCGKPDIEYGLALCAGCHADIQYDVVERETGTPADGTKLERIERASEKAQRDCDNASWPFGFFSLKRLTKLADEMDIFVKDMSRRANDNVDRRILRGDTTSIATFTRGDRSLDVHVYVPANLNVPAQTEYDVVLVAPGRKLINVVKELRTITGAGLTDAKRMTDEVPSTILRKIDHVQAERIRQTLEDLGASVEVR